MHCVVFGATASLGTRLFPQLLAAGHTVRAPDSASSTTSRGTRESRSFRATSSTPAPYGGHKTVNRRCTTSCIR